MAKMLAKQIDHARDRIKELSALKISKCPERPTLPCANEVKSKIKRGEITVTSKQLRTAFDNLLNGVPVKCIRTESGYYDYNRRRHVDGNAYLGEDTPSNIEEALRNILCAKEIEADVKDYLAKREVYDALVKKVNHKAKETEDLIVLGDQHVALQALQDFEAFQP